MTPEQTRALAPRMEAALEELKDLVRRRYPEASFRVARSPESPETILLKPVVDVDDRDAVMDLVIDRLGELQIDEQLPLFVVPVRPTARNEAIRRTLQQAAPAWRAQQPPLLP